MFLRQFFSFTFLFCCLMRKFCWGVVGPGSGEARLVLHVSPPVVRSRLGTWETAPAETLNRSGVASIGAPWAWAPDTGIRLGLVRVTVRRQKISILSFNIPLQSPLWAWCLVEPRWSQQLGDLCWPDWPARNRLSGSRWRYIVSLARLYYLTSWVLGWGPGQCPDSPAVLEYIIAPWCLETVLS